MVRESLPQAQSNAAPNGAPLQSGDRLSRPEFERRYAASPHIKKAELIEGIVYVASPLRHEQHGKPHSRIITWLGVYQAMTTGVDLSDAPTVGMQKSSCPVMTVIPIRMDTKLYLNELQAQLLADL